MEGGCMDPHAANAKPERYGKSIPESSQRSRKGGPFEPPLPITRALAERLE
jgi:hypothetical protein